MGRPNKIEDNLASPSHHSISSVTEFAHVCVVLQAKECLSAGLKECPAHHKDLQYYLDKLQAPNP